MLAYPNIRVKSNLDSVWQRTTSKDKHTFDVGMKPTEMFMSFDNSDFVNFDGTYFKITGALKVLGDGTITPGYYLYNTSDVGVGGMYESSSNVYIFGSNRLTLTGPSSNNIVMTSTGTSMNKPITLSGLGDDDSEDHVVAIDDTTGLLTKRSVSSIVSAVEPIWPVYGSMYLDDGAVVVTITDTVDHFKVDGTLGEGYCSAVGFQNSNELLIEEAGYYEVNWSMSFTAASNNQLIEGSVSINGMYSDRCVGSRFVSTGADRGNMGGTGIIALIADDVVTLSVANYTSASNITIDHCNVVIRKIQA